MQTLVLYSHDRATNGELGAKAKAGPLLPQPFCNEPAKSTLRINAHDFGSRKHSASSSTASIASALGVNRMPSMWFPLFGRWRRIPFPVIDSNAARYSR